MFNCKFCFIIKLIFNGLDYSDADNLIEISSVLVDMRESCTDCPDLVILTQVYLEQMEYR